MILLLSCTSSFYQLAPYLHKYWLGTPIILVWAFNIWPILFFYETFNKYHRKCFSSKKNLFGVECFVNILEGLLTIQHVLDLLVEIAGFTHFLAGFTQHLNYRLFPANTCYSRPAIKNSRWLAGKSPCDNLRVWCIIWVRFCVERYLNLIKMKNHKSR